MAVNQLMFKLIRHSLDPRGSGALSTPPELRGHLSASPFPACTGRPTPGCVGRVLGGHILLTLHLACPKDPQGAVLLPDGQDLLDSGPGPQPQASQLGLPRWAMISCEQGHIRVPSAPL